MDKQEAKLRAADGRHRRGGRAQGRQHYARHAGQRHVRVQQRRPECAVLSACSTRSPRRSSEYDKTVIEVAGHTDSVGSDAYNQRCPSGVRIRVAAYLSGHGVTRTRMVTVGAGRRAPVASNDTERARAEPRVEITIVPVTQESVQKAKKAEAACAARQAAVTGRQYRDAVPHGKGACGPSRLSRRARVAQAVARLLRRPACAAS